MIGTAKKLALLGVVLTLGGGCQSPTTATSSSSSTLKVTVTTDPSFAKAQPSTGVTYTVPQNGAPDLVKTFPYQTSFAVTLQNNDATGMNITAVTAKVQQAISGIVVPSTTSDTEHYSLQFSPRSGSKRLEANGSATYDFTVFYALPNGGAEALITVSIAMTNDNNLSDVKGLTMQVFP